MLRRPNANFILFLFSSDLLLTFLALFVATQIRVALPFGKPLGPEAVALEPTVYGLVLILWVVGFLALSVYDSIGIFHLSDELRRVALAVLGSSLLVAGALYLTFREVSRLLFVYFVLLDVAFLFGFRIFFRTVAPRLGLFLYEPRRVLIAGAGKAGQELARLIQKHQGVGLVLVGFVDDEAEGDESIEVAPVLGSLRDGPRVVQEQKIDEVIFALPLRAHRELLNALAQFERLPVNLRIVPDLLDLVFFRASVEDFHGIPLIGLRDPLLTPSQRILKRSFDLTLSLLLLLFLWPAMLLIALLIKLDSPGPTIFVQGRVGENGRVFRIYKFRTMVSDAEERLAEVLRETPEGKALHKTADDPRVTRVGRFLRRSSLDELPQLFNVLKGEMSLVGPRPELPWLVDRYEPWQWKRFSVPPGITGWWQVSGRSERAMHLHTEDDLWYIQNYSLLLDLEILWRTIGAVLRGRGSY